MGNWDDAAGYMRVAAFAIFVYDWLLTLPAEIRMYRRQESRLRPSVACILLVLVRYLGLAALITNLIGFFAQLFINVPRQCQYLSLIMPVMQCFAVWASHVVFVARTVGICNNDKTVSIVFTLLATTISGVELFAQLHSRKSDMGSSGNCVLHYDAEDNISYVYYLAAALFDLAVVVITCSTLRGAGGGGPTGFMNRLWNSSIVYFCVTTVFNIVNMVFYAMFNNSGETVFCAMGIAVTSIASTRVILDAQGHIYPTQNGTRHMSQLSSGDRSTPTPPPIAVIDICPRLSLPPQSLMAERRDTFVSTYAESLLPEMSLGENRMSSQSRFIGSAKHDSAIGTFHSIDLETEPPMSPSIRSPPRSPLVSQMPKPASMADRNDPPSYSPC